MKLSFFIRDLELKHTFTIAHQSRDVQDTVIVKLEHEGLYGLGETTTNPFYGMTQENICESLENARDLVENGKWETPQELWELCKSIFEVNPFAQCALDMAAWDIFTKKKGRKLYEYLNLNPKDIPLTNFTIGIDSVEKMVEKMKEVDWPLYKIKLGTPHDMEIIRELRKHTDSPFRIDANCAWTAEQAILFSEELKRLNVEFMEQPLGKDDLEGMKEVYKYSKLPVIADESCIVESDVKKCHGLFHGINVKLVKAGGITPGLRMIAEAKKLGMKTMVGCMTESSVGITAIAHIAPLLDYVDMDGAMLLKKDIARGVVITSDSIVFPDGNGIGAEMVG
ncbi:dipeptide epimerase [Belliella sp. DSM 107340]|uniref:Dipeptide epimerase n=1 Tax=Belliella calami TaxID=2923436 RepID=A0ABS9UNW0_9BACT|nr:dipeptide epimerase [Belliella calami]MCH7397855.1 dipeptide epimerase [Belliella calami]